MSQIFKPLTSSGPIPPIIPTSFQTDNGTAVPIANVLIVHGDDSIENNTNGIIAKGGVVGTGTGNEVDVIITNRISVNVTTTDATPTNTTLMTMTNGTSITFRVLISGYDAGGNVTTGGELVGIARATGGAATVVGTNDTFDESDVALAAVDWDVVSNGANLDMQFTGIAATTITWRALFEYTQSP